MEIRNNLISRVDINSISKSNKLHQLKRQQHHSYKQLADVINKEKTEDGRFINIITNTKFVLDDQETLSLSDTTIKYYLEQLTLTPHKKSQLFIPLIEIPDSLSNPKLIFCVNNGIKHTSSTEYQNVTSDNIIKSAIYKYVDIVREQLEYPNKKKLHLFVSCRPNGRTAVYKFQILDLLITKQGNVGLAKLFKDNFKQQTVYVEKYNDWYFSSASENRWIVYGMFVNGFEKDVGSVTDPIVYESFSQSYPKIPLVLSINYYSEGGFQKKPYETPFDNDEYTEEEDNSDKIQLFIDEPKARYYDLLLKYLPSEYKNDLMLWKEMIKSCKNCTQYKLLFKEFTDKTPFADLFESEWKSKDNVERIPTGYYHQLCLMNPEFVREFNNFLMDYVETILYQSDFDMAECDATTIIRFLSYGRFYFSPSAKANRWWYFVYEDMDSGKGEVFKWKECSDISTHTMPIIYNEYRNLIREVKKRMETSFDDKKSKDALKGIKMYCKRIGSANYPTAINKILPSLTKISWLNSRIDSYPDVFGVLNGIVELNVAPGKVCSPEPNYITGYSKYFISKSANANYRPFNKNDPACKIWLDFMKDTTPEKDARMVKWFLYSTGLDQACVVSMVLQIIGGGSNGKSVEMDNTMFVLGPEYAAKLRGDLLMGKTKPGQADNDLMQMKNKNIGFICETDQNDVLVASRLKTLAEYVKTGRKNYGDPENFQTNCTVIVATNFALNIVDTDHGTFRRTAIYRQPHKYVSKPNPKYPEERQMDRKYERLAMNNPEMADGLLACLIHKRIKFHQKYNSEIDKVPMPTIEKYTNEYKIQQNTVMSFLSIKLVRLKGYDRDGCLRNDTNIDQVVEYYMNNNVNYTETITLEDIIADYRLWYKNIGTLNKNDEILGNEFRQSAIGKLLREKEDGRIYELNGYRLLEQGKKKLEEEEYFS